MVGSTFPVWVILGLICFVVLLVIACTNYYMPRWSKLRAECMLKRPPEQRANCVINLRQLIDDKHFIRLAFLAYIVVSISFMIENREMLFNGSFMALRIIVILICWIVFGVITTSFMDGLMKVCQESLAQDRKDHYQHHYGVTVVCLDYDMVEEYYELFRQ